MITQKESYEAPETIVVELEHQGHIMQLSGIPIPDYGDGGDPIPDLPPFPLP